MPLTSILLFNKLQIKLKESLKGKKFLIVLDDVWNDNYDDWDELRTLFVQGKEGSKILVTTRKESVACTLGNDQILSPDILSSEDSWSLFKRHAFEKMDPMNHQALEKIGKEIAEKCKGLPLALKTLAGMLRSKSDVDGWTRILRSEIWELPNNGILPALMLSYNDLPSHLKICFAYCAIFPKDFPFCKEQVIHLWIANSLVEKLQHDETIEDSGKQYFFELRSRSLFESVPNSTQSNSKKYLMHDLVNDLAHIASSKLCIRLEDSEGYHMLERSRHLSFSMGISDFEKLKPLGKLEQLRTFLPIKIQPGIYSLSKRVLHNTLPTLTSLRALSLSGYLFIKKLPDDLFIKLRLLRFLDLEILSVASGIQTMLKLSISYCEKMKSLPERMQELLPSLNRLRLYSCPEIESFPEGGLPFSLEVLNIRDCGKLLNGRKEWHLKRLPCLNDLTIKDYHTDEEFDWELPASIHKLEISNLKTLSSQLLKSLTSLTIINRSISAQFQSLEFSVLNYLWISGCNDQILSLPESASLSTLIIGDFPNIPSLPAEGLQRLTSLRLLMISGCNKLQSLAESVLPSSLSVLKIWYCPNLKYLPVKGMPSSISTLHIAACPLLKPSVEFEKGDYWPKIAHIPTLYIDSEYQ